MNQTLRLVLVGAGRFGTLHARVWTEVGARVVGVVDVDVDRARELAANHGALAGTELADVLARVGADAVVVASEESTHVALTRTALEAGCHVFVEKPFAMSTAEAVELHAQAARRGKVLFAGHVSRFAQPYVHVAEALAAGRLGKLWTMRLRRDFSREWFASWGDRVHPVWESCIHDIDLAISFARHAPVRVVAASPAAAGPAARAVVAALVTFENGVTATIESAWALPAGAPTSLAGALALDGTIAAECEVIGSEGLVKQRLVSDAITEWTERRALAPDLSLWPEHGGRVGGALRSEVEAAVAAFVDGREDPRMPVLEAVWGVQVAEALVAALTSGQPQEIEPYRP